MRDKLDNLIIVKDNYLKNYNQVIVDSSKFEYKPCQYGVYPGIRTENLADNYEFADTFISDIIKTHFPYVGEEFSYAFHFHKNLPYEDVNLNEGWIHVDPNVVTGLVYLTPGIVDDTAGTSFYRQIKDSPVSKMERNSRATFIKTHSNKQEYLSDLESHNSCYEQIMNVPYVSNRMVAFDCNVPHRPNNYKFKNSEFVRLSILFYIFVESLKPKLP